MKWFKNMKISVKLISAFIVVALLAGAVGVTGIINLNKIDTQYSDLYIDYGVGMGDMGKAGIDFHKIRVLTRDVVILEGSQDERIKQIGTLDQELVRYLDSFESSIRSDVVQQKFTALKESISQYNALRDKVFALAQNGQKEEALTLLFSQNSEIVEKANTYIDELFAEKQTIGTQKSSEYTDSAQETILLMVVIVVVAMLLAVLLGIVIARMISNPVRELVSAANRIADGDLGVVIEADTKDEVGQLSSAFRRMSDNLNEVMSNIRSASEQVAAGSKQMSESSITLSQGATEQASSIEELTASIEEISAQTSQNAFSAEQVNSLTQGAMGNAVQGNGQMQGMLLAMDQINESSGSISKIIKVIDEIAFQTNILALNAAVEAARAGQHGKGFAVVAEEVRNLAARSANAAKETTAMIESSIKKVESGTKIAADTADALEKIVADISKVATIMEEITAASTEQAAGISQINQGVMQLSQVVQANSATSEESASASEELAGQAELMREQVNRFKLKEQSRPAYSGAEQLSPEVLRMLERMSRKQNGSGRNLQKEWVKANEDVSPVTIALSDKEFGKYGL